MGRGVVLGAVFHSSPLQLRNRSRSIAKRDRRLVLWAGRVRSPDRRKSLQNNLYGVTTLAWGWLIPIESRSLVARNSGRNPLVRNTAPQLHRLYRVAAAGRRPFPRP